MNSIFFKDDELKLSIREDYEQYLGTFQNVIIERPIGFKHPSGVTYKLNYGFIPGTKGMDGDEIDVYILDEPEPLKKDLNIQVKIIGVIIRYANCDDIEAKYVAVTNYNNFFSKKEIEQLTNFMECKFKNLIISI